MLVVVRYLGILRCLALVPFLLFAGSVFSQTVSTEAPARYALVIGNSNYVGASRRLKNPPNDAKIMAQSLRRLGFKVVEHYDLNRSGLAKTVAEFSESLPSGSMSLVFYAGHGMQISGSSYLIPVDMQVTSEQSVPIRAYPLRSLLEQVSAGKSSVNVVVLDACRDNPFQPASSAKYRNFTNLGLAPIQAPRGTLVAYSTAPGQLAADGTGDNSVYTEALAKVLLEPELTLEQIFKKVGDQVRRKTLDDQIPWFESSLVEEFFFTPPKGIAVRPGRPLSPKAPALAKQGRGIESSEHGGSRAEDLVWYRTMADDEWLQLEHEIQQRALAVDADNLALMVHKAGGGSVILQTALAKALLRDSPSEPAPVLASKQIEAERWLRRASDAGFPIAQLELSQWIGQGRLKPSFAGEAEELLAKAGRTGYPRALLAKIMQDLAAGRVSRADVQTRVEKLQDKLRAPVEASGTAGVAILERQSGKRAQRTELRKELAAMGLRWTNQDFGNALMNADVASVRLYLEAGWNPLSNYEEGHALAHFIWRVNGLDADVSEEMLTLFVDYGVGADSNTLKFRGGNPSNMAMNAIRACNSSALAAALKLGSTVDWGKAQKIDVSPAPDGITDCDKQLPVIEKLLDATVSCRPKTFWFDYTSCTLTRKPS